MEPPYKKRRIDDDHLDSDHFENDGFIVFEEETNRKKRKRHKKRKNRQYNVTPLTEDEKRMIAESQGKIYKKNIDIDQGISDIDNIKFDSYSDSDSSDSHQNKRKLIIKRSILDDDDDDDDDNNDESEDDESDKLYQVNNNDEMDGFNGFIEERLCQLFGNNIYSFLNIPAPPNCHIDIENENNTIIPVIADKTCPTTPPITKQTKLKLPVRSFPINPIHSVNPINYNQNNGVCANNMDNNNDLRHRNIDYPLFYNISRNEAYKRLSKQKGYGQILFRPSSRNCRKLNCLSMTWKMYGDLYSNIFVDILIIEKDKIFQNSIGKTLIIDDEKYEDLDEIFSNLLPGLNQLVDDMMNHKHFRFGDKNDIKQMLKEQVNSNNNGIKGCYSISFAYQRPGYFLLSYISDKMSDMETEYIGITGKGYKFRYKYYKTASDLINFWKRNPQKTLSQKQHKMK